MDKHQMRKIEIALSAELHSAERSLQFAVSGDKQEKAVVNYRYAFARWNNFVFKGVVPEDLRDVDLLTEDLPVRDENAAAPRALFAAHAAQA